MHNPFGRYDLDYGVRPHDLFIGPDADARRRKSPPEISALTGKQPLAVPTTNRKAALLEKALRRQGRSNKEGPSDGR